ncbi:MAG: hypothetical protein RRY20_08645, partial [Bilophila sp.]
KAQLLDERYQHVLSEIFSSLDCPVKPHPELKAAFDELEYARVACGVVSSKALTRSTKNRQNNAITI